MKTATLQFPSLLAVSACLLLHATAAWAQPPSLARYQLSPNAAQIQSETKTTPADDAVLNAAPEQISLLFPNPVRLVKLTLRNQQRDWVDIEFRYNPRPIANYSWELPELIAADYYIADWAILSENDRLVRGSFSFAFGPNAQAPSFHRAAEEALLQQRYGDPEIRYVPPPPTTIIIDRDPPNYDPPFTINLDGGIDRGC